MFYSQKWPPEVFHGKRCSYRSFAKFTGKHLCQSLLFNKVAGVRQEWKNSDAREHCLECYMINSTGHTQKRYLEKQGRETEKLRSHWKLKDQNKTVVNPI